MSEGIIMGNVKGIYVIKASLTPTQVATITTAEQTFSVPSLRLGDEVIVTAPSLVAGVAIAGARVSAKDTLAITFANPTAAGVTPVSGDYRVTVIRPAGSVPANSVQD